MYRTYICWRKILSEHCDKSHAVPDQSCQCELNFEVVKFIFLNMTFILFKLLHTVYAKFDFRICLGIELKGNKVCWKSSKSVEKRSLVK